jgi:hypothetical protein
MNKPEGNRPEYLITLPRRGLQIIPPAHTEQVMRLARRHKAEGTRFTPAEKIDLWPSSEKTRLRMIKNCKILEKRHPVPEDGKKYMESVDYSQREVLFGYAQELAETIIASWEGIEPQKPIAVLLYGSVAKGLVKGIESLDPSNIDMAVIGDISD